MALLKCPDCQKDVSDKAVACPNCGSPIAGYQNLNTAAATPETRKAASIPEEIQRLLPYEAKSILSSITFDGKYVVISRGRMNPLGKGETKIAVSSINSIEWRAPGLNSGFLRFNVAQGLVRTEKLGSGRGMDAAKDDHAVLSLRSHSEGLLKLKDLVEQVINTL